MLKVVHEAERVQRAHPARSAGRCSMRSSATVHGRCWPRRCRPRSPPTSTPTPARSTPTVTGWWSATATTTPREVTTAAGAVPVSGAAGQRQAHRRGHRGAEAVLLGDPAGLGAEVPAGRGGAAAAVPARPVLGRLRPGVGAVPRLGCGPVGHDDHPADRAVARRGRGVQQAVADGHRLRLLWVDGIHLKVRLEQDKVCLLVIIGVRADGTKDSRGTAMAPRRR